MILSICEVPEILNVLKLVKLFITIIKIAVPIILVVVLMIDFISAIKVGNEDLLKKAEQKAVKRGIAAVLIFLVPTLANVVIKISMPDTQVGQCLNNATDEGINAQYAIKANEYVSRAERSLSQFYYNEAVNYLKNVSDETEKENLETRLSDISEALDIAIDIDALTSENYFEQIEIIKEKIDSIDNENFWATLNDKLEKAQERIFNVASDYPIVPFGEHELYKNLKVLRNKSLSDFLIEHGSSVEALNEKIRLAVYKNGVGTREAAVAAAITLIGSMAEYGYQLPYYWGGKRYKIGVSENWGTYYQSPSCNEYYFDTQEEIDRCKTNNSYRGLDCTGFVNWTINQARQEELIRDETNEGTKITLDPNKAVCKIGDGLSISGHMTIIVGIDEVNKRYIIAEESSNMEIDSIPFSGVKGRDHYWCDDLSHNYIN